MSLKMIINSNLCSIDESHKSSSHSNKLLVYNGGIPEPRINNFSAKKFGNMSRTYFVTKALQILRNIYPTLHE